MGNLATEKTERIFDQYQYNKLEQNVNSLADYVGHLRKEINFLHEEIKMLKSSDPKVNSEGSIFKVVSVFFNKTYEYKGIALNRFIVELEGYSTPFVMDRKVTNNMNPEAGGTIFCKIDGDKLKDVEIIHEI